VVTEFAGSSTTVKYLEALPKSAWMFVEVVCEKNLDLLEKTHVFFYVEESSRDMERGDLDFAKGELQVACCSRLKGLSSISGSSVIHRSSGRRERSPS
jgi:hypothetical protein